MFDFFLVNAQLDHLEQDQDSIERQADSETAVKTLFVMFAALG